jgi:predicted RNase H-like HicB family nuclease
MSTGIGTAGSSEYLVVYEKTPTGYSAYVPDLPGCITTGATLPDTRKSMQEAICGHLAVMREFGDPIPQPTTIAEPMQVPA